MNVVGNPPLYIGESVGYFFGTKANPGAPDALHAPLGLRRPGYASQAFEFERIDQERGCGDSRGERGFGQGKLQKKRGNRELICLGLWPWLDLPWLVALARFGFVFSWER